MGAESSVPQRAEGERTPTPPLSPLPGAEPSDEQTPSTVMVEKVEKKEKKKKKRKKRVDVEDEVSGKDVFGSDAPTGAEKNKKKKRKKKRQEVPTDELDPSPGEPTLPHKKRRRRKSKRVKEGESEGAAEHDENLSSPVSTKRRLFTDDVDGHSGGGTPRKKKSHKRRPSEGFEDVDTAQNAGFSNSPHEPDDEDVAHDTQDWNSTVIKGDAGSEMDGTSSDLDHRPDQDSDHPLSRNDDAPPMSTPTNSPRPHQRSPTQHLMSPDEPLSGGEGAGIEPVESLDEHGSSPDDRSNELKSRGEGPLEDVQMGDKEVDDLPFTPEQPPFPIRGLGAAAISSTSGTRKIRSYGKRQAKPSFYDRAEEELTQRLSESPPVEAAISDKAEKTKRRLPIEVSGGTDQSPATQKKRRKEPTGPAGATGSDDEEPTVQRKYQQGPLTKLEIAQVTRAVEGFRSDHRMQERDVNDLISEDPRGGKPIHLDLWRRVQNACPTRSRRKLIRWSRQHFHNFVARGTWTEEQDDELRDMIKDHGQKWTLIGNIISRHPADVRDRWRDYLVCSERNTNRWTHEEVEKFIDIVSESLLVLRNMKEEYPNDESLQPVSEEQMLDWGYVSEKMGFRRGRLQCQEQWKRLREGGRMDKHLSSIFSPDSSWRRRQSQKEADQMSAADKHRLASAIHASGAAQDSDIPWKTLVRKFGGRLQRQTLVSVWASLRQSVPDSQSATTNRCARHLVQKYQKEGVGISSPPSSKSDPLKGKGKLKGLSPRRAKAAPLFSERRRRTRPQPSSPRLDAVHPGPDDEFVPESEPEGGAGIGGKESVGPYLKPTRSRRTTIPAATHRNPEGELDDILDPDHDESDGSVDLSTGFQAEADHVQESPGPAKKGQDKDAGKVGAERANGKRARNHPGSGLELEPGRPAAKRSRVLPPTSAPGPILGNDGPGSAAARTDSVISSNMSSDMDDIPARLPADDDEEL